MQSNYSLANHNSFRINVNASLFCAPENLDQLDSVSDEYDFNRPFLVLGEGSNLLLTKDFDGLVLNPRLTGIEMQSEDRNEVWVKVGAGVNWDQWVEHTVRQGWFGLENLSLIPGSVGSAPVQNIGAYGVEMNDRFAWLDAWDLYEKRIVRMHPDDCHFGYRTSVFKKESPKRHIITHVTFRLLKTPRLQLDYGHVRELFNKQGGTTPAHLREVIISIRRQKLPDPSEYGNAGSFFQNPVVDRTTFKSIQAEFPQIPFHQGTDNRVKIPAAWLIDTAGWKGVRRGRVGTWPGQPLVIVNYGGASGQEILDFSEEIRNDVYRKFGIYLEREVNVIG
jgi:UDP-N-acetylmuramate dehydrogenase